jgi:hypothetical protein
MGSLWRAPIFGARMFILWRARCRSTINSKTLVYSRCHATQQWKRPAFSLRSVMTLCNNRHSKQQ